MSPSRGSRRGACSRWTRRSTLRRRPHAWDIPLADPNRLNNLTILYAELATSDPVLRQMRRDGPIRGKIIATPVVVQDGRYTLPLIDLVAIAATPLDAMKLSLRSATAFQTYLTAAAAGQQGSEH